MIHNYKFLLCIEKIVSDVFFHNREEAARLEVAHLVERPVGCSEEDGLERRGVAVAEIGAGAEQLHLELPKHVLAPW